MTTWQASITLSITIAGINEIQLIRPQTFQEMVSLQKDYKKG
jgi:hypothetical protein